MLLGIPIRRASSAFVSSSAGRRMLRYFPARPARAGQVLTPADVLLDHGRQRIHRHLASVGFGVALRDAPLEVRKRHDEPTLLRNLGQRSVFQESPLGSLRRAIRSLWRPRRRPARRMLRGSGSARHTASDSPPRRRPAEENCQHSGNRDSGRPSREFFERASGENSGTPSVPSQPPAGSETAPRGYDSPASNKLAARRSPWARSNQARASSSRNWPGVIEQSAFSNDGCKQGRGQVRGAGFEVRLRSRLSGLSSGTTTQKSRSLSGPAMV
jgi:hypothetical protein